MASPNLRLLLELVQNLVQTEEQIARTPQNYRLQAGHSDEPRSQRHRSPGNTPDIDYTD
jgi:hypothetical protein